MRRWLALLVFLAALFVSARLGSNALAAEEFALDVNFGGSGSGTAQCKVGAEPAAPCQPAYPEGTELSLAPEPNTGSEFVRWGGACSGEGECELTMEGPRTVAATFNLEPVPPKFTLTLNINGTGKGTVQCEAQEGPEPCQAKYPEGTELALLPSPSPGSEFAGFGGACSGQTCEVEMAGSRTVSATFNLLPPGLKYTLAGERIGTRPGSFRSEPGGVRRG